MSVLVCVCGLRAVQSRRMREGRARTGSPKSPPKTAKSAALSVHGQRGDSTGRRCGPHKFCTLLAERPVAFAITQWTYLTEARREAIDRDARVPEASRALEHQR